VTLVDTNVLIDVISKDPKWFDWSRQKLEALSGSGPLLINDIIYAELSARFASESLLREAIETIDLVVERLPQQSLFPAGQAFGRHRAAGGPRTSLIADFLIGAHAAVAGIPILTRDARRYRTYFPDVELIAPD
jgi:predicted nucleic acid-binding protein